jgi:para-nitrobenzyl esterase
VNLTADAKLQRTVGCSAGNDYYGDTCPQLKVTGQPWLANMSEDCLFLQVYGPSNVQTPKPVMVFFYGGSFDSGSAAIPIYNGQTIGSYSRDTVVVAANYRLGALGFLASESSLRKLNTTGNFGLLDQIAALTWVQARISDFGGDPARVTIFGESAGGASVCALMTMPLAEGLFSRAIVESGVCQDVATLPEQYALSNQFAQLVACKDGNDTTCLK